MTWHNCSLNSIEAAHSKNSRRKTFWTGAAGANNDRWLSNKNRASPWWSHEHFKEPPSPCFLELLQCTGFFTLFATPNYAFTQTVRSPSPLSDGAELLSCGVKDNRPARSLGLQLRAVKSTLLRFMLLPSCAIFPEQSDHTRASPPSPFPPLPFSGDWNIRQWPSKRPSCPPPAIFTASLTVFIRLTRADNDSECTPIQ